METAGESGPTDEQCDFYGDVVTDSAEQLPNCLITTLADGKSYECWQCEDGYTYDDDYHCAAMSDVNCSEVDSCSYCTGPEKQVSKRSKS